MSFLTSGAIQAPIHSVPFIDRFETARVRHQHTPSNTDPGGPDMVVPPLRRSMPLFLRAVPEAHLFPSSNAAAARMVEQACDQVYAPPPPPPPPPPLVPSLAVLPAATPLENNEDHGETVADNAAPHGSATATSDLYESQTPLLPLPALPPLPTVLPPPRFPPPPAPPGLRPDGPFINPANPLSSRAMTAREYTINHAIGMRPWRLGAGTDF